MPPAVSDSEPESSHEEVIPAKKSVGRKRTVVKDPVSEDEEADVENEAQEEEDGDDDEEEEEVYQVEEILDHDLEVAGEIRYEVKWLGYDNPEDRTWESEENLQGAKDILQAYYDKIGGRPEKPGKSKKRGRKSVGKADTPDKPAKKIKSDEEPPPKKKDGRGRKRKSEVNDIVEMMDIEATQRDGWEPPKALPGAWEEGVVSVHTIEGTDDGTKWAYLMWADEGEDGKKRQTKAKLSTCYIACPQMMLKFFETHLVFTDKATNDKGKKTNGN